MPSHEGGDAVLSGLTGDPSPIQTRLVLTEYFAYTGYLRVCYLLSAEQQQQLRLG
ncbi:hypothetical protein [Plantactinospora sp. KLBMP9567]|uniref:hypothetical protein n=1 Tax=Plantactinospora sp. KLBMP9567 TaxID=3085900 RepID=UPI002980C302|nr:hypothetical protein [Plantactinospora sp. KLBMP9567]MDW5327091.1 hypothetical protein [Plantactinospora sp. KLBMP9567]